MGKGRETACNSKVPEQISVPGITELLPLDNAATSWHPMEIHEQISPVTVIQYMNHEDAIPYTNSLNIYLFINLSNHILIYIKSMIYHLPIYLPTYLSTRYSWDLFKTELNVSTFFFFFF